MQKLFSKVLWGVLTGVFAVLFAALLIGTYVIQNFAYAATNMMFGTSTLQKVDDPDAKPTEFFKTSYNFEVNGKNLYEEDRKIIEEAEAAGAVLLWNKPNTLPLAGNESVSCFGHASVEIVECGSGSGYVRTFDYKTNKDVTVTLRDALTSRGFDVNDALWNLYATGAASGYKMTAPEGECKPWQQWKVNEAPWSIVNQANSSFASYDDVALVVLARSGGEYSDLHYNYANANDAVGNNDKNNMENTVANGGYLGLTDQEDELLTNLTQLKEDGVFKKVVVLLNTGNPLQMKDLNAHYAGIDACMWIGQPGSSGINAVVDLLKGKDMKGNVLTPSGHLTDTWVYDNNSAPATVNDGNYTYGNSNLLTGGNLGSKDFVSKYMVYQEGIYIGYRYYETRYADAVMGRGNATSTKGAKNSTNGWNYTEEVAFPFGYGLSYTTFEYGNFSVEQDGDTFTASVTVTNKGSVAGKEAIQLYLQKPYTDYDQENDIKIEKSAIELVGYAKTEVLQPNASKTYTIEVDEEAFKTYDANGEGTYILEKGDYYFTVASDAHAAINNVLDFIPGDYTPATQSVMGGGKNTANVVGASVVKFTVQNDNYNKYAKSTQTGYDIENQLDSGDINKYENRGSNSVTYLSRKDWDATYPTQAPQLNLNAAMVNDLRFNNIPDDTDYEMPEYQLTNSIEQNEKGIYIANPKKGDVVAYQFIEAPLNPERETDNQEVIDGLPYSEYWEEMWTMLLDEMAYEEQVLMVVDAFHLVHGASSIALPESKQENGPVGITKRNEAIFALPNDETIKGENGTGWTWVAYPCAGIVAASFDSDIAERVGQHKSEDMLYLGYNGIYGPGVNMHRSPFGGRAFEYPSEDPYLAGMAAAYESKGIESKGCMAYAKHYALNDMETNRVNCGVWSNEQASREIYLRAFEIVFTEGGASATMNSFTRIGTRWNGACYAMMTTILREEWGYDGLVISDWVTEGSAMSHLDGLMAGTDTFDGNGRLENLEPYKDNAAVAQALRRAAKRIIYNIVRTNAMNGTSITTRYISVTPWWEATLIALEWVFGGIFVVSAGMLVSSIVIPIVQRKKQAVDVTETTETVDKMDGTDE